VPSIFQIAKSTSFKKTSRDIAPFARIRAIISIKVRDISGKCSNGYLSQNIQNYTHYLLALPMRRRTKSGTACAGCTARIVDLTAPIGCFNDSSAHAVLVPTPSACAAPPGECAVEGRAPLDGDCNGDVASIKREDCGLGLVGDSTAIGRGVLGLVCKK
jgi:hypothetical protein